MNKGFVKIPALVAIITVCLVVSIGIEVDQHRQSSSKASAAEKTPEAKLYDKAAVHLQRAQVISSTDKNGVIEGEFESELDEVFDRNTYQTLYKEVSDQTADGQLKEDMVLISETD